MARHVELTFVVPIRHPDTVRNPHAQKKTLANTFASLANQEDDRFRVVIAANEGTDLPDLPKNTDVAWVSYPPNPQHELTKAADRREAMNWVRLDKGRRAYAAIRAFPASTYFMMVDDDDFVSRRLTSFVAANSGANGWFIERGYAYGEGGGVVVDRDRFHKTCGSSHIVRGDLYDLPQQDDPDFSPYVRKWFGSHGSTTEHFEALGAPLAPLPFHGAIYLVNNPNSHSRTNRLIRQYVLNKDTVKRPWSLPSKLRRIKRVTPSIQDEFFGPRPGSVS